MGKLTGSLAAPSRLSRWIAVVVTVAAALAAGCGSVPASSSRPAPRAVGPAPTVDVAAFRGHGELAFVSRGHLWVLDGMTGELREVPAPGVTPLDPVFSPDGRWLAFLGSASPAAQADSVWLATGGGGAAHEIAASGGLIGWSPAADVLAVTAGDTIRLVWPSGHDRTLVRAPGTGSGVWPGVGSAVWSPDGRSLAVSRGSASAGTLVSYPVAGGRPTTWLRLTARGGWHYLIDPAGWWPHQGIGYWAVGACDSCNADGDPFSVIPSPGTQPRRLGLTLADTGLGQVSAAPDGRLAIVAETPGPGGGRVIWQDRAVIICGLPAGACAGVPQPASTVTLDPAWSPTGGTLVLVRAPYRASPGFPQHAVAAWYSAHQLWLYDPAHGSLRELNATGASVPSWSADGTSLLYVARDALWLLPRLGGQPVQVAGPLFPPGNWPSYYGQVNWVSQFAWWSGQSASTTKSQTPRPRAALALPPVGAPGFPVSIYPPPRSHKVLNLVGECPNPSGLQPPGPGMRATALAVENSLGRSFRSDLRLTDRVYWQQTLADWRQGLENANAKVSAKARRSGRVLYSGPLDSYHQAFGPPDMSRTIREGCGSRTARDTWMIVEGPVIGPALQGEDLLLDRRGHVLLWNFQ